jgi:predicted phosphohydrolase
VKRLAWCTDIHLDFLDRPDEVGRVHDQFAGPLSEVDCDAVLITGDISLSPHLVRHLGILDRIVDRPIYFVLGNHDFYGGSFDLVRSQVRSACAGSRNLRYLTGAGPVHLTDGVALVGDDGWYDALHGDASQSPYIMSDWFRIADYLNAGAVHLGPGGPQPNMGTVVSLSRGIAFDSAMRMQAALTQAARTHETLVVLTHVPPWVEAHRHDGKSGSPGAHPWYTSKLMGDAIEEVASRHPHVTFEVFCGHTHGRFDHRVSENIVCHVGGSEYGSPGVSGIVQVP